MLVGLLSIIPIMNNLLEQRFFRLLSEYSQRKINIPAGRTKPAGTILCVCRRQQIGHAVQADSQSGQVM